MPLQLEPLRDRLGSQPRRQPAQLINMQTPPPHLHRASRLPAKPAAYLHKPRLLKARKFEYSVFSEKVAIRSKERGSHTIPTRGLSAFPLPSSQLGGIFVSQETRDKVWRYFYCHNWSEEWQQRLLLKSYITQQKKNHPAQNVNSAAVEKPWAKPLCSLQGVWPP
jgi:hypothetical protein